MHLAGIASIDPLPEKTRAFGWLRSCESDGIETECESDLANAIPERRLVLHQSGNPGSASGRKRRMNAPTASRQMQPMT